MGARRQARHAFVCSTCILFVMHTLDPPPRAHRRWLGCGGAATFSVYWTHPQLYLFNLQSLSESQDHIKDKTGARKKAQSANAAAKVFSRYDVVETSYHFYSDRIDLHLCDDPGGSK